MGFGDIVGLMKDFEKVVDEEKAEEDAKKLLSGNFDMWDFLEQIRTIKKMKLMMISSKMPFFSGGLPEGAQIDDGALVSIEAIIQSMTKSSARIQSSSRGEGTSRRIGRGSGRQEVVDLIAASGIESWVPSVLPVAAVC